DGHPVTVRDASDARRLGIDVVYQDLALAECQPVFMNLFLGRELTTRPLRRLDKRRMIIETERFMRDLGVHVPSGKLLVRALSGRQRQGVAVARATRWPCRIVLLDEPTAALGVAETARVEETLRTLRERGVAILLVSQNLEQVFRIADRVCVLRNGA